MVSVQQFQSPESSALDQARVAANGWLSEFAPLLNQGAQITGKACRNSLATIGRLRASGPETLAQITPLAEAVDQPLLSTLQQSIAQLDSIESDTRERLALIEPGSPQGKVDLDALKDQLAEREARQEVGAPIGPVGEKLELSLSKCNWAAAGGLSIFALGWNGFTLFHCIFMIGGMWKAFGPLALLLLLFYAIFFAAGFAMIAGVVAAASDVDATLEGRTLTVRTRTGSWVRDKRYELDPTKKAYLGVSSAMVARTNNSAPRQSILLTAADGKEISLTPPKAPYDRDRLVSQINLYLAAQQA